MTLVEATGTAVPDHAALAADLRVLRERGLLRLRRLNLPALEAASVAAGLVIGPATSGPPGHAAGPTAVERLVRRAVEALGDDLSGRAAQYLFGLVQGTVGRPPTELRELAAAQFERTPETFRKGREGLIIARVADEILLLAAPERPATPAAWATVLPPTATAAPRSARSQLQIDLQRVLLEEPDAETLHHQHRLGPYRVPCGGHDAAVTVHLAEVQTLRDIDILVTSTNVFLDPSRAFAATIMAQVRSAARELDAHGVIRSDPVGTELAEWIHRHGTPGSAVHTGLVVPTSSGQLTRRGIRRLYHAAVAAPVPATNRYLVTGEAIRRAVAGCFALAAEERDRYDPPLRSLCLPLFGAGRAGLPAATSIGWLWPAIQDALAGDPGWDVHLITWRPTETAALLRELHRSLDEL